ncbi:MFS transporter [Geminicoccus flavidas]|uniref:MFS transporter n=1 Tax=Geminicoccus flavidas TaxID=2506407 RepID=UPI0013571CAB|nr:MFS transporter [Geminicoccus flavidas]
MTGDIERRTMRKVHLNVLLLALLFQVLNYFDRVNLSFAALTMGPEIGLTAIQFGIGASVFFVSYALFEIPSNLAMHRFGANVWIARILISCSITAMMMALVSGPLSFYLVRFLFGAAEAGLIPGLMLYVTYWYPQSHRAFATAVITTGVGIVGVLAGPVSGLIIDATDGMLGLSGWRWMFILEAAPLLLIGIGARYWLANDPATAPFLAPDERQWLSERMAKERAQLDGHGRLGEAVRNPRVWLLGLIYFLFLVAVYALQMWLPQIIKSVGDTSNLTASLLSAGPPFLSVIFAILLGLSSDRHQERRLHLALPLIIGGGLLIVSTTVTSPALAYLVLCLAWGSLFAPLGIFWAMAGSFLTGVAAAAGLALINTLAQFGGLVGPTLIGYAKDWTGDFAMAIALIGCFPIAAGLLALARGRQPAARLRQA